MSSPNAGTWCHIEINANDVERCKAFYGEVFGWSFTDIPEMGYTMYTTREGGIGGGMAKKGDHTPNHMVNYVLVDDIEETVQRIDNNGGSVVVPKTEVEGAGWFALVKDTQENVFGIWKSARQG